MGFNGIFNGCIANQSSYNVQHPCCLIFLMEHGDLSIIKHENLKLIHDDWLIVGVSLPFECSGWSQSMNWDWPWLKWERHWNIMGYNGISMAAPLGSAQLVELVVTNGLGWFEAILRWVINQQISAAPHWMTLTHGSTGVLWGVHPWRRRHLGSTWLVVKSADSFWVNPIVGLDRRTHYWYLILSTWYTFLIFFGREASSFLNVWGFCWRFLWFLVGEIRFCDGCDG